MPTATPLGDDGRQFLAAEYETIGAEKNDLLRTVENDRTFGIVSTGAFWAWIASQPPLNGTQRLLYVTPLGILGVLAFKRYAANVVIDKIGAYIRETEGKVLPEGMGWERYVAANRKDWFRKLDWGIWLALLIANLLFARLNYQRPSDLPRAVAHPDVRDVNQE